MADIELVIKIDEEVYKSYKSEQNSDCVIGGLFISNPKMYRLITNATPLPKGHWEYIGNSEVNGLKICECSNCKKRTYGSHKYCPNCGAKMEWKEDTEKDLNR